jgi:DNA-binding NtrC family response regulator
MSQEMLNILIVDDDAGDREQIKRAIKQARPSWKCTEAVSISAALAACGENGFDCIRTGNMVDACAAHLKRDDFDCTIVDYHLPAHDGLTGVSALHQRFPYMAIIMATGQGDEMIATAAMKRGASDYIRKKDLTKDYLRCTIEAAVEKAGLLRAVAKLSAEPEFYDGADEPSEDLRLRHAKDTFLLLD